MSEKVQTCHPTSTTSGLANTPVPQPTLPFPSCILYHLKTIYLLTYANIPQFILPTLLFGLSTALSPPLLQPAPSQPSHSPLLTSILPNIPLAFLWIWSNTIIFDLTNQRHPASIREDQINKPYRPIPSGRLTSMQARRWTLYAVSPTYGLSCVLGAGRETPGMYLLLWMYNELGGSEEHWIIRNALNAVGYVWCSVGSVAVVTNRSGSRGDLSATGWIWCGIICLVIASTMHIQDLRDQEGDKLIGRRTMPLAWGDRAARWSIAGAMVAWSCLCCAFWTVRWSVWILEGLIMGICVWRLLWLKGAATDAMTYKFWGLWLSSLYLQPLSYRWDTLWHEVG